jgi:hypothetical protein
MKKIATSVCCGAALIMCAYLYLTNLPGWTRRRLESAISARISVGSNSRSVEEWLQSVDLKYRVKKPPLFEYRGADSICDLLSVDQRHLSKVLVVEVPRERLKFVPFKAYDIRIFFFFDDRALLIRYYVDETSYSL